MAGAGAKLFVSGDVLTADQVNTYLMDQTIMKFASTSARDAAFGGAGEPTLSEGMFAYTTDTNTLWFYTGSAWQNVLGSNIGEISTSNRNIVINGGMQIWQRGTSSTGTAPYYSAADRWQGFRAAAAAGATWSQQVPPSTSAAQNFNYATRMQRNSGNASTASLIFATSFETVNVIPLRGKTLTLSFYARCGANYSPTSSILSATIVQGTGTDGNVASGFTGQTNLVNTGVTLTTSYQKFTTTASSALGTTIGQLGVAFYMDPTGTAGVDDWVEITGVQLEAGAVATPFEFEDYGTTLAKCQRYYYRVSPGAAVRMLSVGGQCVSTTVAIVNTSFPTKMRTRPTAIEQTGTAANYSLLKSDGARQACSAVPTFEAYTTTDSATTLCTVASGLVAGNATMLSSESTDAYLAWSAEL